MADVDLVLIGQKNRLGNTAAIQEGSVAAAEVDQPEFVALLTLACGYLAGSGWQEYQQGRAVCGVPLPAGLNNASRLPEPIFTPAAKAAVKTAPKRSAAPRKSSVARTRTVKPKGKPPVKPKGITTRATTKRRG